MNMIAMPSSSCSSREQVEDLGLRRHVQRGRRLVGDQQGRLAGQRGRDRHPLPHPAAELERVRRHVAARVRDTDAVEHLDGALVDLLLGHRQVQQDRLHDLVADGVDRAERGHRLLEHHGDLVAADLPHLAALGLERSEIDDVVVGTARGARDAAGSGR